MHVIINVWNLFAHVVIFSKSFSRAIIQTEFAEPLMEYKIKLVIYNKIFWKCHMIELKILKH